MVLLLVREKGLISCLEKMVLLVVIVCLEERVLLFVNEKGLTGCQGKGTYWLSGERVLLVSNAK